MMGQVFLVILIFNRRSKTGSLPIKPDNLMNGANPWQPASFVSPTTTLQSAGVLPSAHGVLAISAAAGAGGITFATHFHDVYVFQATTVTKPVLL